MCNCCRMLRAILNLFSRQHPSKHQLYGHLPHISKTIKIRQTKHAGHCCRSKDELISHVPLRTPSHGRAMAGRPGTIYTQQLRTDTGYSFEDLPGLMDERDGWWVRVREILLAAQHDDIILPSWVGNLFKFYCRLSEIMNHSRVFVFMHKLCIVTYIYI